MSLDRLPAEVLLIIEWHAKNQFEYFELAPSLQLSWVCQQLRSIFMPRFWSFVRMDEVSVVKRSATLLESSPPDTYRDLVKYLAFAGASGGVERMNGRFYLKESMLSANDELESEPGGSCGPRVGEQWPTPAQLIFDDPKRYFKLARRRRASDSEDESDETGSSAASEAEEEERKCTVCHSTMHQHYRHRVKPEDYWLPGAVHSVGPLEYSRRTWGRYKAPDGGWGGRFSRSSTIEDFLSDMMFVISKLNFETFEWAGCLPIPRLLCEQLLSHPTFHKFGVSGQGLGQDCFRSSSALDDLLLLAPKISVLQEKQGTSFGQYALPFERGERERTIFLPLADYPEGNSMRGFMTFLLAAKRLKHLSAECKGAFITPGLLGVFARLHSLHWDERTWQPDEHVVALNKLRSSLWKLAKALDRPDHMLEAADVQLLADSAGEHADIAAELTPLASWLEQEELAALVAQGWNEQEERGPNESPIFYPPYLTEEVEARNNCIPRSTLTGAYQDPTSFWRV